MAQRGSKGANESDVTSPGVGQKLCFDDETLKTKAEVYLNEGNEAYRKKDYSNAVYLYTEGIEVNSKDEDLKAKLYSNRAVAHLNLGNYSGSLRDAKVVKDIRPLFIKAIRTGAKASAKLGLFEQARTWSDEGLAVSF
ncbi:Tetratricopeptide repeat protein 4 [Porites harrisoni]